MLLTLLWAGWHLPTFSLIQSYREMTAPMVAGGFLVGLASGSLVLARVARQTRKRPCGRPVARDLQPDRCHHREWGIHRGRHDDVRHRLGGDVASARVATTPISIVAYGYTDCLRGKPRWHTTVSALIRNPDAPRIEDDAETDLSACVVACRLPIAIAD